MDDSAAFARLMHALRPWLTHLVIVGGWAHDVKMGGTSSTAIEQVEDRQVGTARRRA